MRNLLVLSILSLIAASGCCHRSGFNLFGGGQQQQCATPYQYNYQQCQPTGMECCDPCAQNVGMMQPMAMTAPMYAAPAQRPCCNP